MTLTYLSIWKAMAGQILELEMEKLQADTEGKLYVDLLSGTTAEGHIRPDADDTNVIEDVW